MNGCETSRVRGTALSKFPIALAKHLPSFGRVGTECSIRVVRKYHSAGTMEGLVFRLLVCQSNELL